MNLSKSKRNEHILLQQCGRNTDVKTMNKEDEVSTEEPNMPEPFIYNDEDEKSGGGDASG